MAIFPIAAEAVQNDGHLTNSKRPMHQSEYSSAHHAAICGQRQIAGFAEISCKG